MSARPFRYEWDGTVRRLKLSPTVKLVASYVSQYADTHGNHIRPGIVRLATETGFNEKTIRRALAKLRDTGLLVRVRSGSAQGRRGQADEYRLAIPDDLLERVELVTEINTAAPSVDPEHRTPDVHCSPGTPDSDARNTGHQESTHQPETTPAVTTTPDIYSLTRDPLTPREADLSKSDPILDEEKPRLRLVHPAPKRGFGFCLDCHAEGRTTLSVDTENGSACEYHLRQEAS